MSIYNSTIYVKYKVIDIWQVRGKRRRTGIAKIMQRTACLICDDVLSGAKSIP